MDKKIFIILLFITATGLCTGAFFEVFMSGEGKDQLISILENFFQNSRGSNLTFLESFCQSFKRNFIFLFLYFLSPLLIVLLPLDGLYLFCKGLFTGFSATMLIEAFGIKGVYYTALTLLPSGILHTVLFSFLGTLSIQEGIQVIQAFRCRRGVRGRNNKNALQLFAGQYFKYYLAGLGILTVSCLLEAFFLQIAL